MNVRYLTSLIAVILISAGSGWAQTYSVGWSTVAGGGGTSASTDGILSLSGTIGQAETDLCAGGSYSLTAGFWAGDAPAFGPPLHITRSGSYVIITWTSTDGRFALQTTDDLAAQTAWGEVAQPVFQSGDDYWVAIPATRSSQFFRLSGREP
jgi:hypothetical protein